MPVSMSGPAACLSGRPVYLDGLAAVPGRSRLFPLVWLAPFLSMALSGLPNICRGAGFAAGFQPGMAFQVSLGRPAGHLKIQLRKIVINPILTLVGGF